MSLCKCGKVPYRSRLTAARVLVKLPVGRECRVYQCKYRNWHTTSKIGVLI